MPNGVKGPNEHVHHNKLSKTAPSRKYTLDRYLVITISSIGCNAQAICDLILLFKKKI